MTLLPVATSQTRTVLSVLPVARYLPSLLNARQVTAPEWPVKLNSCVPVLSWVLPSGVGPTKILASRSPQVATLELSGEKATPTAPSLWALTLIGMRAPGSDASGFQMLTVPALLTEAISLPLGLKATPWMLSCCAPRSCWTWPDSTDQTSSFLSSPPETSALPSGRKATV